MPLKETGSSLSRTSTDKPQILPLWPIILLLYVTFSFGAPRTGIPLSLVLATCISLFMLLRLNFRLQKRYLVFIGLMYIGYSLGTVVAVFNSTVDLNSFLNLIISSMLFVVVASYSGAFASKPRGELKRFSTTILGTILALTCISIFEIFNYQDVFEIRNLIHGGNLLDYTERDIREFGLMRPTAMYSEPSRFAQAMGILLAIFFLVKQSVLLTGVFFVFFSLLIKSPMILYSVPLIFVIYLYSYKLSGSKRQVRVGVLSYLLPIALVLLMLVFFGISQQDRLLSILLGQDGSFYARFGLPVLYMSGPWDEFWTGSGVTPQIAIYEYINILFMDGRSWLEGTEFRLAISPPLAVIIGMGIIGSSIFMIAVTWLYRWMGIYYLVVFYGCSMLASGLNSISVFLPMAILFGVATGLASKKRDSPTSNSLSYD